MLVLELKGETRLHCDMAAGAKSARRRVNDEDDDLMDDSPGPSNYAREKEDDEANASHLVSFLTGYDNVRPNLDRDENDDDGSGEDGSDRGKDGGSEGDDYNDLDGGEDDMDAVTPTKRSKTGLVGIPGSGRSTSRSAKSTPRKRKTSVTPRKAATPGKTPLGSARTAGNDKGEYGFLKTSRADQYFLSHAKTSKTSGNSYSSLVRPLSQAAYESHTSSARFKGKSRASIDQLLVFHSAKFPQWELELEVGYNLLLYGYGSKRRLINRFVSSRLSRQGHCVVVNGHFPRLGIKDILSQVEDTLGIPQDIPIPASAITPLDRSAYRIYAYFLPHDALPKDRQKSQSVAERPLYLIIHNIDSPTLRTPRSLAILSLLACSPNIHILASFDHIHTPLLFSSAQNHTPPHRYIAGSYDGTPQSGRGFNWLYHNTTTYDDYDLELTYQRLTSKAALGGISSSSSTGISEEGALQILRSVPPMALRLLKLLLTKQLSSLLSDPRTHVAHAAAVVAPTFAIDSDVVQRLSREKFIAREEERYDALMGEFKDHGLVVEAQSDAEGRTGRWVWIPLGKAAIERVLETMRDTEV